MRVLRRRPDNLVQFGAFGLLAALLVWRGGAVSIGLGAVFAVLAVRTMRAGVRLDPRAGITVRNTFSTHRIPWDDFDRADLGRAGVVPIPAVVLRRRSGGNVALWCIQPPGRGKRAEPRLVSVLKDVHTAIAAVHPEPA